MNGTDPRPLTTDERRALLLLSAGTWTDISSSVSASLVRAVAERFAPYVEIRPAYLEPGRAEVCRAYLSARLTPAGKAALSLRISRAHRAAKGGAS
jgi:hypothetical protein